MNTKTTITVLLALISFVSLGCEKVWLTVPQDKTSSGKTFLSASEIEKYNKEYNFSTSALTKAYLKKN